MSRERYFNRDTFVALHPKKLDFEAREEDSGSLYFRVPEKFAKIFSDIDVTDLYHLLQIIIALFVQKCTCMCSIILYSLFYTFYICAMKEVY